MLIRGLKRYVTAYFGSADYIVLFVVGFEEWLLFFCCCSVLGVSFVECRFFVVINREVCD